jgi:hypothetical protein
LSLGLNWRYELWPTSGWTSRTETTAHPNGWTH